MRSASTLAVLAMVCLGAGAAHLEARSAGAPAGVTGAPGDGLCTNCHTSFAAKTDTDGLKLSFGSGTTTYVPGQTQTVTVTIDDPTARRWGFEVSPRVASSPSDTGAGKLTPGGDGYSQLMPDNGTRQWITHTSVGTRPGTAGPTTFNFSWTAPATDVGPVTFYVAANAANNNGNNQGDQIYNTKVTLTPATAPTPTISSNGVVNGANFKPGISPGSWISILGSGLSLDSRIWDSSKEIVNGNLPTSLDNVSVTVNGKSAAVYYISPTQLNVQAPDDSSVGPVDVVVTSPGGKVTSSAQLQKVSPALFQFDPQSRKYAAATFGDGSLVGPPGLFGTSLTTRGAKPGETVILYGTGFGGGTPAVPSGTVFSGAAPLANPATVSIGGIDAKVAFAGLSGAGLCQFNVVIPDAVANGDQAVVITVAGQRSPDGVLLTVQR